MIVSIGKQDNLVKNGLINRRYIFKNIDTRKVLSKREVLDNMFMTTVLFHPSGNIEESKFSLIVDQLIRKHKEEALKTWH